MLKRYGVLRGKVIEARREDGDSTPHFQIFLSASGARWRVPVNVKSADGSEVCYMVVDPLDHPVVGAVASLAEGFHDDPLPAGRLDYVRAPLFDRRLMKHLPPSGSGANDDLQDLVALQIDRAKRGGASVFAFGEMFTGSERGVHDIHMNQGNPGGNFAKDNGVSQDGGLVIIYPNGARPVGLFFCFLTQSWFTEDSGAHAGWPQPGAPFGPFAERSGTPQPTPRPTPEPSPVLISPDVIIIAALVNPTGSGDSGKETVTLLNTGQRTVDLTGFRIADRMGNADPLTGNIEPGDTRRVQLAGRGAQLGNKGGAIRLLDGQGRQLHAVSYSATQAVEEGRTVVFDM